MVFLAGPRQVGKTTLAQHLLAEADSDQYYTWDKREHKKIIREGSWDRKKTLVVFDELHKFKGWKNWLKGIYDTEKNGPSILVTGSAKLDVFRRGGDSLLGRYFHYRLHPFSVKELVKFERWDKAQAFDFLWERSGFPEPLFSKESLDSERWKKERLERILREDLLSIENVRNLGALEDLVDLLRERVASPISYKSISEDLSVAPQTVKSWIELLERMYVVFQVIPYSKSLSRAIKKEPKVYFYDYSDVPNPGARFENLIAAHLLKLVHFLEDTQGQRLRLCTLRDKEKREVDFLVSKDQKPILLVEAKLSDRVPSDALRYYSKRLLHVKAVQVTRSLLQSQQSGGIRILSAPDFLMELEA